MEKASPTAASTTKQRLSSSDMRRQASAKEKAISASIQLPLSGRFKVTVATFVSKVRVTEPIVIVSAMGVPLYNPGFKSTGGY
jgi:hypothetical protein